MIKINLLTVAKAKKARKRSEIESQLILAAAVFALVLILCGYGLFHLNKKIRGLQETKSKVNKELTILKEQVKEVENYEKNKQSLEEKNAIIERLTKNQDKPVHVLDEVSQSLEPQKIWLTSLALQGNQLSLDGKAISNSDIVEFINRLKALNRFTDILLIESRQIKEGSISIYSFKLKSTLAI